MALPENDIGFDPRGRDLVSFALFFMVEGPLGAWREMLENIRQHHIPDREHTLNYLTLPDDPMRVSGPDQLETDAFYRYNETLQRFFNGSASVETIYH